MPRAACWWRRSRSAISTCAFTWAARRSCRWVSSCRSRPWPCCWRRPAAPGRACIAERCRKRLASHGFRRDDPIRSAAMKYDVISADGHVDLIWLPPDLFTANASAALKERMPHVVDGPKGPEWVSAKGAKFGLVNGMGSAGREYVPGVIYRSDRMASTGLYDDGKKGIRRLTLPDLRLQDQDRDGVQAE